MNRSGKFDLLILTLLLIFGIIISLAFNVKPLTSAFLFFAVPSVFLLFRRPKNLHRVFAGTFLFGLLFGFGFDFMALLNNAWSEPVTQLFFPNRILGIIAVDHIIWFIIWTLSIITFYEHFLEHDRSDKIKHNYWLGVYAATFFIVAMLVLYYIAPTVLLFRYAYFTLGVAAILPLILLVIRRPHFFSKFAKVIPYFFSLYFSYELIAIYLGQWTFPGQYVGMVSILGLEFPFEEFLFWTILSSVSILSYYELFVDDGK